MVASHSILFIMACLGLMYIADSQVSTECSLKCNDLRTEVLTLSMCKDAKKILPKPKVGDFCSIAMENGFLDACTAICMNKEPVSRISQNCRSAAKELPRPTVRKWCEHGYKSAYEKTVTDLKYHFNHPIDEEVTVELVEAIIEEHNEEERSEEHSGEFSKDTPPEFSGEEIEEHSLELPIEEVEEKSILAEEIETRSVRAEIPITIDEDSEVILMVYDGQNAEEAVIAFCRKNSGDDIAACVRQLLPTVIDKLGE